MEITDLEFQLNPVYFGSDLRCLLPSELVRCSVPVSLCLYLFLFFHRFSSYK